MQQIEVNSRKFMIVEVPEGATMQNIEHVYAELFYWSDDDLKHICDIGHDSEIIGFLPDISEEQWAGIVPHELHRAGGIATTSTQIAHSLLRANNIPLQNRLLIEIV